MSQNHTWFKLLIKDMYDRKQSVVCVVGVWYWKKSTLGLLVSETIYSHGSQSQRFELNWGRLNLFLGLTMARVGLGLLSHLDLTILLWSKTAVFLVDVHPLINKRQTNSNEYTHWPVNTIHRQQSHRWGSMQCHQLVNSLFIRLVAEILILMLQKPQLPVPSVPLNTLPALQTIIPHSQH